MNWSTTSMRPDIEAVAEQVFAALADPTRRAILAALAWRHALGAISVLRRHQLWITRAGGLMLVAVGLLLLTGWWDPAVQWLQIHLVNDFQPSV